MVKWTVFIRVRNAVHRVKNASVRDNNVITQVLQPADNGGVNGVANANEHGSFHTATTATKN